MKSRLRILSVALCLTLAGEAFVFAADSPTTLPTTAPSSTVKLPNTIGVDFSSITPSPDKKTVTVVFHWKGKNGEETRSAIITDQTVIGIDGEVKTLADLDQSQLKKKAVATVGEDGITAISLRIGRKKIVGTPDQIARATPKPTPEAAKALARSNEVMDKRIAGIVAQLDLNDSAKEARVTQVITTDLRAVRDAHNLGFTSDKSAHEDFNKGLSADLTPAQVEKVKDIITINKVPITFKAYHVIVANLTPDDDTFILAELKAAREDCMEVKSIEEVNAIFKEHKKKIEAYLDSHGHNWKQSLTAYDAAQKNGSSTQPAGGTAAE